MSFLRNKKTNIVFAEFTRSSLRLNILHMLKQPILVSFSLFSFTRLSQNYMTSPFTKYILQWFTIYLNTCFHQYISTLENMVFIGINLSLIPSRVHKKLWINKIWKHYFTPNKRETIFTKVNLFHTSI